MNLMALIKPIDKIRAVVNDEIITQSMIDRVKENMQARANISPAIYQVGKKSDQDIINIFIHRQLIRKKLEQIGYIISDEQVEERIKETEKRLNVNREALLQFLSSNNMTFDEYFEIIRETIEYMNLFEPRIIFPMISVTDQEVKNHYYKMNSDNNTLSFKYTLVDFSLPKQMVSKSMMNDFTDVLKKFQLHGNLPEAFKEVNTSVINDIQEDGLAEKLKATLKKTNEGEFSDIVHMNNEIHIFFVKKKDLAESEVFQNSKEEITRTLYELKGQEIKQSWFEREMKNYHIKIF